MLMQGRGFSIVSKYSFNGQERDIEVGNENYSFSYRMYESRICKFLSVDPLIAKFPYYSPFQFAANQPIHALEIEGLESSADLNPTIQVVGSEQNPVGYSIVNRIQIECLINTINHTSVFLSITSSVKDVRTIFIYDKGKDPNIDQFAKSRASSAVVNSIGYIGLPKESVDNNPGTLTSIIYELTNIMNHTEYEKLESNAKNLSKDQFVKGFFNIEAQAVFNALEFQYEMPAADDRSYSGFKKYFDIYKNGGEFNGIKVTKEVMLDVISTNIYSQNPKVRQEYESKYDILTKKTNDHE
jgi:RHS repeat-associated protein